MNAIMHESFTTREPSRVEKALAPFASSILSGSRQAWLVVAQTLVHNFNLPEADEQRVIGQTIQAVGSVQNSEELITLLNGLDSRFR